jgi:methyl-accepting chemotaxis protein
MSMIGESTDSLGKVHTMSFSPFRRLRLGARIALMSGALSLGVVIAFALVVILRVSSVAQADAATIAARTAQANGAAVTTYLSEALDEARGLAKVFEAASNVVSAGISRRQANSILEYFIGHSPRFFSAYVGFEPNAYDGKDRSFIDERGHDATGRFIPYWTRDDSGNAVLEALKDYAIQTPSGPGANYWVPKYTGKEALIDPYVATVQGRGVLMTSLVAPIRRDGTFIGVAGIDLTLNELATMVGSTVLYETGSLTLCTSGGSIVAARDLAQIGRPFAEGDAALAEAVAKAEPFQMTRAADGGARVLTVGFPVQVGESVIRWMMVATIPTKEFLAPVTRLIWTILIVGFVAMAVSIGGVLLIARSITRPLAKGVAFAEQVAAGSLDVTVDVGERGDEIGQLATALNRMATSLRELTLQVQEGATQLASSSEELSATAQEIARGAQDQAATLEETAASVEQLTASVDQVAVHSGTQTTTVGETTMLMEGMLASVTQVSETLGKVAASSAESVERARAGTTSVKQAVASIREIAASSQKIAGIVTTIADIASQTNLLSLNAAIEAARAGEHGLGFAVVADEVSKLAGRSARSSKEIAALIKETLKQVRTGVEQAEGTGRSMELIIGGAHRSAEMVDELQRSIGGQVTSINAMAAAIQRLEALSQSIGAATGEQSTNAKQVARAIENVNDITQQAASASEEMASSTEELTAMAQQLQGLVARLRTGDAPAAG